MRLRAWQAKVLRAWDANRQLALYEHIARFPTSSFTLLVSTEIHIASNAPHCPTSRGFFSWRFADADPGGRSSTFMGPASENLVWGPSVSNKKNVTHVSHFVTSADGLAAMVAPCSAALSRQAPKPRPARRRRGA